MNGWAPVLLFFRWCVVMGVAPALALRGKLTTQDDEAEEPPRLDPAERSKRFQKCLDNLRKVGDAAGLTELHATETGLAGKAGGLRVHLERVNPDQAPGTRIAISGLGHLSPGIHLQRSKVGVRQDDAEKTGDA